MRRRMTPRELDVLRSVAAGRTTKEIASSLGMSRSTVNWHVTNLLDKLGAANRTEAVAIALREELLDPEAARQHDVSVDLLGVHLFGVSIRTHARSLRGAGRADAQADRQ